MAEQQTRWRITSAFHVGGSLYDLELESDAGDLVEATVSVGNRASRSARHEPADWSVFVELCDDDSARAWLEAHEHEYEIGHFCKHEARS